MSPQDKCKLSFYKEISRLTERISIVRHVETNRLFVRKDLSVYDLSVYQQLQIQRPPHYPEIQELIVDDDGTLIVIEEYISGETLSTYLEKKGPLPEKDAADIIRKLCEAVAELHNAKPPIVHRDLKPDNVVMLTDGSLRIIDLNSAKNIRVGTRDTILIGTQGYAAPEQYGFSASNEKTDVYAIGVIFREMLLGTNIDQPIPSKTYKDLIERCLSMEPNARPTLSELQKELDTVRLLPSLGKSVNSSIRSWLPPGFRSGNVFHTIFGVLIYCSIFYGLIIGIQMLSTDRNEGIDNIYTAFGAFLTIFWFGNYRNCQRFSFFANSNQKSKRYVGVFLTYFLFVLVTILVMEILFPGVLE